MPKVSIIVPIYNTEQYLTECIESILAQTYKDFELLLINDGSSDNSGKICNKYAQQDSRVIVVHKENSGANYARKTGVNISKGEWITFVDSDDIISSDYLKILTSHISESSDIIIGQIKDHNYVPGLYTINEYRIDLLKGKYPCPYTKLYKSTLFTERIFNTPREIVIGEDQLMNIRLSFGTNKSVLVLQDVIYKYRIRSNSIFHSHNHSYNYSNLFFSLYLKAIPSEFYEIYSDYIFLFAYNYWSDFCGYKYRIPLEWQNYEITKYVIEQSSRKGNLLKKYDLRLIKSNNIITRVILILLKKLNNRFRL